MRKYIAEGIGTFALVFCGTGAMTINEVTAGSVSHVGVAVTFGLIVMAMVYSLGDVSGAHLNPAVTLAFAAGGYFSWRQVLPYIGSQLLGAVGASFLLKFLFPASEYLGASLPAGSALQSFVMEIILAFILMLVIFQVAHGSKETGIIAGLAIGGVVLLEAMFAGPVSGASMNPARSLAPAIAANHLEHIWVYILAPCLGALLALIVHQKLKEPA